MVNNKKEQAALYVKLFSESGQGDVPMKTSISAEIWEFLLTESSLAISLPSGCAVTQVQPRLADGNGTI